MHTVTKHRLFKLIVLVGALGIAALFFVGADFLFFYIDNYNSDIVKRVKDRAEKGQGIYESVPQGLSPSTSLRLRRLNREMYTDRISPTPRLLTTNALGYRCAPDDTLILPKEADEYRILALGDSITLGAYGEYADSYPDLLEKILQAELQRRIEVYNAGIGGASLNGSLDVLLESGLLVQPDIVFIGMYLNDAAASPVYRHMESGTSLDRSPLLSRIHRAMRYRELENDSAKWYEKLSGNPFPPAQPDGAWRTSRDAFEYEKAKACADWGNAWYPWAWEQMRIDLEQFVALERKYGFELVVALFPCTQQVEADFLDDTPQQSWMRIMAELGITHHLDLLPPLRARYQRTQETLALDHCHLKPEGNRFVAGLFAELLMPIIGSAATRPASANSLTHRVTP